MNSDNMFGPKPAVLAASTEEQTITLEEDREYTLAHDGEDATGAEDTHTIYLSFGGAVDADAGEGADKAKLKDGRVFLIGPGISILKFKCAAGAPTFSIAPGRRVH